MTYFRLTDSGMMHMEPKKINPAPVSASEATQDAAHQMEYTWW